MTKKLLILFLFVLLFSSCSPSKEGIATQISIEQTSTADGWTATPSSTPMPTETVTPIPTNTPTRTLVPSFTPTATPEVLFSEVFDTNTLKDYRLTGAVAWNEVDGTIRLGNSKYEQDNRIYMPYSSQESFVVIGRVFIPTEGLGKYDSVAIAIKGGNIQYFCTNTYGPKLADQNKLFIHTIIEDNYGNQTWGDTSATMGQASGWYTIKILVSLSDYRNTLFSKTWKDGDQEPGWQVHLDLKPGFITDSIGFRMYGMGTDVDDLQVTKQK